MSTRLVVSYPVIFGVKARDDGTIQGRTLNDREGGPVVDLGPAIIERDSMGDLIQGCIATTMWLQLLANERPDEPAPSDRGGEAPPVILVIRLYPTFCYHDAVDESLATQCPESAR